MQVDGLENTGRAQPILTARRAGLVACNVCGKVHAAGSDRCRRCHAPLHSRAPASLQRVWAWWLAGLVAYIPATKTTIVGGVIELMHHGSYFVAGVVFSASVMIPVGKFIAIAYLAISVRYVSALRVHTRQHLYEVVEFIGRWSMIDVFVVAILSALVQFKFVASVHPGIAAVSFALSVAFTMLSAQSFDSRLIWDADEEDQE